MIWLLAILIVVSLVLAVIVLIQGAALNNEVKLRLTLINRCVVLWNALDDDAQAKLKAKKS